MPTVLEYQFLVISMVRLILWILYLFSTPIRQIMGWIPRGQFCENDPFQKSRTSNLVYYHNSFAFSIL